MTESARSLWDRPELSMPLASASARFETRSELFRGLPLLEHESAQIGQGDTGFTTAQAFGCDVVLSGLTVEPRYTGHIVPKPEWLVLFTPLRWHGDFTFNGQEARPNDLFLSGGPDGYSTRGQGRSTLAIGVRKIRLQAACEALAGAPFGDTIFADRRLSLDSALGTLLRRSVGEAMSASLQTPLKPGRFALPSSVEADLITTCALLLLEQGIGSAPRDPGRIDAISVVRKAKVPIDPNDPRPVTLADLCEAGGVGKVWLHKCFVEVHGISPMKYLRAQRLTVARERLLARSEPPRSIKEVALSLGFANGGRFAADYTAVFGEQPSVTLARNANQRGTTTPISG